MDYPFVDDNQTVWLTAKQAADLAGVSLFTVYSWERRGLLEATGMDEAGRKLYTQQAIAEAEKATRKRAHRIPGQRAA